jgi:hypothetical protein
MVAMYNKILLGYLACKVVKRPKKNNVSKAISALAFRVLMCLQNQSVSHSRMYLPELRVQPRQHPEDEVRDGPRNVGFSAF